MGFITWQNPGGEHVKFSRVVKWSDKRTVIIVQKIPVENLRFLSSRIRKQGSRGRRYFFLKWLISGFGYPTVIA